MPTKTTLLFTNPLKSLMRTARVYQAIARDLREYGLTTCKPMSVRRETRQITGFIWHVGAPTMTMPTVRIEEQSRG